MSTHIERILVHVVRAPLAESFAFSQGWVTHRSSVLVEVQSSGGISGWGECLCHGLQSPQVAAEIIRNVYVPRLIGRSPLDVEVIWEELYNLTRPYGQGGAVVNALSGIDIALWDLLGKESGLSISRMLGGRFRERVEPYVTGFYRRRHARYPEEGIAEARRHVADGFRAMKLKLGFGPREDIENVRAVRAALGSDIRLMADANCAYAVPVAREILQRTADCGLHFFEEPLNPEDIEGYRLLRNLGITSLAAGEGLLGKHACCRWISTGALDILQPDICSSGGFTELKKIVALCQCWNTRLVPHVWGSGICLAASLQLLATLPPGSLCLNPVEPMLEYDCSDHPFRSELIFHALPLGADGWMAIPDRPGLGIEVNAEVIRKYLV